MDSHVLTILAIIICGTLLLNLYTAIRMYQTVGRMRRDTARAERLADDVKHEWDSFNRNQTELLRRRFEELEQLAKRVEEDTDRRVRNFEELVTRTREELQTLERYIRDVFEVELKSVFDSFDSTVGTVLTEMKDQLLRGLDRVEKVQALVDSRIAAHAKIMDGRDEVLRLTEGAVRPETAGSTPAKELGEASPGPERGA